MALLTKEALDQKVFKGDPEGVAPREAYLWKRTFGGGADSP